MSNSGLLQTDNAVTYVLCLLAKIGDPNENKTTTKKTVTSGFVSRENGLETDRE